MFINPNTEIPLCFTYIVDTTVTIAFVNHVEEEPIIPTNLFEERRRITIRIPFCERNEKASSKFIHKLNGFTRNSYIFEVIWLTRKIKSLFNLKDKNVHKSHVATLIHMECNHRTTQLAETQDPGGFVYCSKKARAKQKAVSSSNSPVPHGSDLTFKYETTRQRNINPDDDF